ncbi:MAG: hypothetical protein WC600_14785 [Desulfobaccales bacterium]
MDSQGVPETPKTDVLLTLQQNLQNVISSNLEEMAQEELGHLTHLLPDICGYPHLCQQWEIALKALEKDKLNLRLALMVREDLESRLDEAKVQARLQKLNEDFKKALLQQQDVACQDELAQFIQLLSELGSDESLTGEMELAAQALLQDKPNASLASKIRVHIQSRLKQKKSLLKGASPASQVFLGVLTFLGLFFLLFVGLPIIIGSLAYVSGIVLQQWTAVSKWAWDPTVVFGAWSSAWQGIPAPLKFAGFAGAAGGITSLMVRMPDFARLRDADFAVLFSSGFFRPLIGLVFAIFVVLIIESGILAVTVAPDKKNAFNVILGFIAGFSEIFARDILTKAEQTVGSLAKKKQP